MDILAQIVPQSEVFLKKNFKEDTRRQQGQIKRFDPKMLKTHENLKVEGQETEKEKDKRKKEKAKLEIIKSKTPQVIQPEPEEEEMEIFEKKVDIQIDKWKDVI